MSIFSIVADLINKILSFSLVPSLNMGGTNTEPKQNNPQPQQKQDSPNINNRCQITVPESINPNARFMSTGSGAWTNQFPGTPMAGKHGGTDFLAPYGAAVYAPFDMTVIKIGRYTDSGRMGDYVIAKPDFDSSLEYYSGHLDNVRDYIADGQHISCGTQIGNINIYNHTHIQIKRNGQIIDPETVLT